MSESVRVGLDLRAGSGSWLGGLYYLQNLALALSALPEGERPELVGLAPSEDGEFQPGEFEGILRLAPFRGGDPRRTLVGRIRHRLERILERPSRQPVGLDRAAERERLDVLFPTFEERPLRRAVYLPWVPDLQHLHLPENFSVEERERRTRAIDLVARHAALVVVSSAAAAADLAGTCPEATDKTRVLRFTTVPREEWFLDDPDQTVERLGLPETFLLLPGQFWVHKNHGVAFEAVRILRERGAQVCLVCTGSPNDHRRPEHFELLRTFLERHRLEGSVRILGVVPRVEYVHLLRAAGGLVQTSLFEGWSSVVEDARALGKASLLSDIPVHREQNPDGARYFPAADAEALADGMAQLLSTSPPGNEREALERQRERVATYARAFASVAREAAETRY